MIVVVAATGTDVGKTHVTCALLAASRARGVSARATKPVATGLDAQGLAEDAVAHAAASGQPYRAPIFGYAPAVSPHRAARDAGRPIAIEPIVREARAVAEACAVVLVETAGGLFSPLGPSSSNADLVSAFGPAPWVLVAPDRLGVLHDVTATLAAAQARGLVAPLVVLSSPEAPDASTGTNAAELASLGIGFVAATFPRASIDAASTRAPAEAVLAALGV